MDEMERIQTELELNSTVEQFVNDICKKSSAINKPFLVALLSKNPWDVKREIEYYVNNMEFDNERERQIVIREVSNYVVNQINRIEKNLILTDEVLINLIECTTGNNIIENVEENNRYRYICEKILKSIFNNNRNVLRNLYDEIIQGNILSVDNIFNRKLNSMNIVEDKRKILEEYNKLKNNITQELQMRKTVLLYDSNTGLYTPVQSNNKHVHTISNSVIKEFSRIRNHEVEFLRNANHMQVRNFPTGNIEDYILSSFERASVDQKRKLIEAVLDNLQLCKELYESYYKCGNKPLTTYFSLTNGQEFETKYLLNDRTLPHQLAILPAINKSHLKNYHDDTLEMLFPDNTQDERESKRATDIFEALLKRRHDIIECYGCIKIDGIDHEMFPWEKIILKTNAFIRGDFFRSTSFISNINPSSYFFNPNEDLRKSISALSITSGFFSQSALNQRVPTIKQLWSEAKKTDGKITRYDMNRCYLNRKCKDLIIKALKIDLDEQRNKLEFISTKSFIGERLKDDNDYIISTLTKARSMMKLGIFEEEEPEEDSLSSVFPIDRLKGGFVHTVRNDLGEKKEFSANEILDLYLDINAIFGSKKKSTGSNNNTYSKDSGIDKKYERYINKIVEFKLNNFDEYKIEEYKNHVSRIIEIEKIGINQSNEAEYNLHIEEIEQIEEEFNNQFGGKRR